MTRKIDFQACTIATNAGTEAGLLILADGIIVAKLDRFARSNRGALEAIDEIEAVGGVLISVAEQIDTSGYAGKFMRNIFFATAQMERERIGEQWFTARSRAVERGIQIIHKKSDGCHGFSARPQVPRRNVPSL